MYGCKSKDKVGLLLTYNSKTSGRLPESPPLQDKTRHKQQSVRLLFITPTGIAENMRRLELRKKRGLQPAWSWSWTGISKGTGAVWVADFVDK